MRPQAETEKINKYEPAIYTEIECLPANVDSHADSYYSTPKTNDTIDITLKTTVYKFGKHSLTDFLEIC